MILTFRCDNCRKDFPASQRVRWHDDTDFCPKCYVMTRIDDLKRQRKDKMAWLEETHLKQIREWDAEIEKLLAKLAEIP